MIIFYDPRCEEYGRPGHPERPDRIRKTVPMLKDRHPAWEWREPRLADDAAFFCAHIHASISRGFATRRSISMRTRPLIPASLNMPQERRVRRWT